MTAQQTERLDPAPVRSGSTRSSDEAYRRRIRREQALAGGRLTRTGSPISAALSRVPYVAAIILLLAGGIVGVLWLNTMSDAAGLRATQSRLNQMDLTTQIEAAGKEISGLQDPARLAADAAGLGLVVPGDAAMLEVGRDGKGTVIGTPTPVPGQAPPAATAPATTAAVTTPTAATAPAPPATTAPAAPGTAVRTAPAAKATAVKTTPAKTTPAKATPVKTTPVKTTALKTTAVRTTAVKTTPARATVSPPTPGRQAPVTPGGRP